MRAVDPKSLRNLIKYILKDGCFIVSFRLLSLSAADKWDLVLGWIKLYSYWEVYRKVKEIDELFLLKNFSRIKSYADEEFHF